MVPGIVLVMATGPVTEIRGSIPGIAPVQVLEIVRATATVLVMAIDPVTETVPATDQVAENPD